MKERRLPAWREALVNFLLMLLVGISAGALHELRALGHSISGILFDSVGIAIIYALVMYFRPFSGGMDPEDTR